MLDHSIEPTPGPAGAETMKAIVQTEYGSAAERVLRLAGSTGRLSVTTRSWSGCVRRAWTGVHGT